MTWVPKYNAQLTKPLIRQILAVIQRDQRAALDFVGGVGILPDIVAYQLSPMAVPQFPAVLAAPGDLTFDIDAQGSLHYFATIYCSVAVTHQNQNAASELVQDYGLAVDAIFRVLEDNLPDFYTAMSLTLPILGTIQTTPLNAGSVKKLFVSAHVTAFRKKRDAFAMSSTLEVGLEMEEI